VDMQNQIADAERFVKCFTASGCKSSTPHIYISALAFCERRSSVYKNYWGHTQGLMRVEGSSVERWNNATIGVWTTNSAVRAVAFSPDGTHIVSGSHDKTIRVWDAQTGTTVAGPFHGHTDIVTSVAFSPDGTHIVSGSHDNTIRVWDAQTGTTVAGPFDGHTNGVISVAFSPDGTHIVSGSYDNTIQVWDAQTGTTVAGLFHHQSNKIISVPPTSNNFFIASGSMNKIDQALNHTLSTAVSSLGVAHSHTSSSTSNFSFCNLQFTVSGWLYLGTLPILWVSPHLLTHIPHPRNTVLIGPDGTAFASYGHLLIGTQWSECFIEHET